MRSTASHHGHLHWMQKAISLAKQGYNNTYPNPRVGCVIVKNNRPLGQGYHQYAGGPHAEISAINHTLKNGESLKNATLYVTLEPCCHTGKTLPCTQTIIQTGIQTVVIGHTDPSSHANQKGIYQLKQAGIEVIKNICESDAKALNFGFLKRLKINTPWFCAKTAATLNGAFTHHNQPITNQKAREHIHKLRARTNAILTTSQTIIADNPRFNIRLPNTNEFEHFKQPQLIILDTHNRITPKHQIFNTQRPVLIFSKAPPKAIYSNEVTHKTIPQNADGKLCWPTIFEHIKDQKIDEVMVESGPTLLHTLLSHVHIDEWWYYLAPDWIDDGLSFLNSPLNGQTPQHTAFQIYDIQFIDNNLLIQLIKQGTI